MAFVIIPEFKVKVEHVDAFKTLIAQHAQNSVKNEDECLGFDACQDPEDPTRFILYEVYVSEASLDIHRETEHYKWFAQEAAPLVHLGPDGKLPQSIQKVIRIAEGLAS